MQTLKTFEFTGTRQGGYDWAKLLDGGIYKLTEGEDYTCKQTTFSTLVRNRAKKLGVGVTIAKVEGGTVIQAQANGAAPKAKGK